MKKVIACLVVGAMLFGFTACSGNNAQTGDKPGGKEETLKYKELTDPRGKTLESTATGEGNPQLVETRYETKDVVIADYIPTEMGYAVDPTGATDSTAGIQKALYDCYETGGGTVYLPVGNYAISDTIYIPPFVTLRGDWQDPDEGTEYGTIISVWMDADDSEAGGAFKMGGSAGVIGVTVYYPLQTLDCIMPYPYTFYVDGQGANGMYSTVSNVTIINGYRGIGTSTLKSHESLQVENVKGTFLYCGLGIANSADVGTVDNLVISNKYWKEASADCMNGVSAEDIDAYTGKYTTGLQIGDLEWTEFNRISVDGCAVGIHTVAGERIEFAGSFCEVTITDCEQGLVVDGLDSRWGAVIAKSHIEGGIVNNTEGKIKLCDVEVVGDIKEIKEETVVIDDSDLSSLTIDYETSYKKPEDNMVVADLPHGLFTDAGPALQKYLDDMAAQGGGVVYVPGEIYRFRTPVSVPAGVELRGSSSVANRELYGTCKGTLFLCYYGDDASNGMDDQAFITLAGENAGMNGIRVLYPENGSKSDDIHSTYTVRGTAAGVYVVNSMIAGSAYGIDFRGCDNHYIKGVVACCYYNTYYLGGNGGMITKCLQNGTVLQRTSAPGLQNWLTSADLFTELIDKVLRKECQYVIIENAKDEVVCSVFAYGCKSSVKNINSENTYLNNIGNDNLDGYSPQICMEGGSLKGVNVMRYNGYSCEHISGDVELYNRIAINEVGEKNMIKSK